MLHIGHRHPTASEGRPSTARFTRRQEIHALHMQCGIYTQPDVVSAILDAVEWQDRFDLTRFRLLEPAAGDGAFVIEAARRLVASCRIRGIEPRVNVLKNCISAFEVHPREARKARLNVINVTRELGLHPATCESLSQAWIKNSDFLLDRSLLANFTHAVGNPPYVRWSKVPARMRATYTKRLPREMIGGDLFLPFLDRALAQLRPDGKCGFLCSDRWRFMAFAENFRAKWLPQLEITSEASMSAVNAYVRDVDAYPSILIASRISRVQDSIAAPSIRSGITLRDCGFEIKVGPALGHAVAFVLDESDDDVERELLWPWIDTSEISDGGIAWRKRHVVAMNCDRGKLIEPKKFPKAFARLKRFRSVLEQRSIVRNGAPWYRPIDRIDPSVWAEPKLLIPEIAKIPRVALDRSGAIPGHGVYAVFASDGKIDTLYEQLVGGGLARALEGISPKIKGGYVRCYKRFLEQIVLR